MYGVKNVLPQTAALNRTEWPFALPTSCTLFDHGAQAEAAEMVVVAAETWQQWLLHPCLLLGQVATAAAATTVSAIVAAVSAAAAIAMTATVSLAAACY
jgi:hypothetical protein